MFPLSDTITYRHAFYLPAAVLSELYLTVICMTNQGGNFWQTITGINKNSVSQATVPGKLWPNTVTVLQTIGVGINLLSLGVSYVIWRDFLRIL